MSARVYSGRCSGEGRGGVSLWAGASRPGWAMSFCRARVSRARRNRSPVQPSWDRNRSSSMLPLLRSTAM